ncbi:MAG: hypothetical protein LBU11_12895 [Zoogloeaceae bacterium]|nr:hypothetical protein [Zoogloeaceae bacterium]
MHPHFFRLLLCLAGMLALPAAYADAIKDDGVCTDGIYTNCASEEQSTSRNTRLRPFRDEVIVAGNVQDAQGKTRAAIIESAKKHKWKVVEDKPSRLRLQLDIRRHRLIIAVAVKGGSVDIDYVDSVNLNYEKDAKGNESIHPNYNGWIRRLLKTARRSAAS